MIRNGEELKISSQQQRILEFTGRATCDGAEPGQFPISVSPTAFRQVGADTRTVPPHLTGQSVGLLPREVGSQLVNMQGQLVSLLPYFELAKILHRLPSVEKWRSPFCMRVPLNTNSTTQENARQPFIEKFRYQIQGVLSGFDRLLLRGWLRRLNYGYGSDSIQARVAVGREQYLWENQILCKPYAEHEKQASERLKKESWKPFEPPQLPVVFLRSAPVDQEEWARRMAAEKGIRTGRGCASSALGPSPTLEPPGTQIIPRVRPCHLLYP